MLPHFAFKVTTVLVWQFFQRFWVKILFLTLRFFWRTSKHFVKQWRKKGSNLFNEILYSNCWIDLWHDVTFNLAISLLQASGQILLLTTFVFHCYNAYFIEFDGRRGTVSRGSIWFVIGQFEPPSSKAHVVSLSKKFFPLPFSVLIGSRNGLERDLLKKLLVLQ